MKSDTSGKFQSQSVIMKKLCFVLLMMMGSVLSAGDFNDKGLISNWSFFPLQVDLGLVKSRKLVDETTDTFFAFGLFVLQQKSAVISVASIANTLQNNYGIQFSPFPFGSVADNNYGISFGIENYCKRCYGIQLGLLNHSWAGEKVAKENERLQFCGINIADTAYLGIMNASNKFQIGLFNLSKGATFQLGLLNYNPKSYIPWLPLVNWDMGVEHQTVNPGNSPGTEH